MSRAAWFLAGAGAGAYALLRARRVAEALTPDGLHDRVLGLEMGRVRDEGQRDAFARRCGPHVVGAQVVLDVTAWRVLGGIGALELVENGLDRFANDVGEHIQTTTVRQAHGDMLYAVLDGTVDERFHSWNECLAAFQSESLLVGVLARDELFEGFRPHKTVENHPLFIDGIVPRLWDFDSLTNPVALILVRNMNVLDSDRTT